jgi:mono/diheme cytochrome c family protein
LDATGSHTTATSQRVPDIREIASGNSSQRESGAQDNGDTPGDAESEREAGEDDAGETDDAEEEPMEREPAPQQQRRGGSRFDEAVIRQGQQIFQSSCSQCHETERATSKVKSYGEWLATVRRMAAMEDADIPASQHVPIATYLASLNPAYQRAETDAAADGEADDEPADAAAAVDAEVAAAAGPALTLNATISPVYRGTDSFVENKGFFPDVWVNLEWRPENNPLSGRVMTCTSCHGTNEGLGVELVEATFTVDLVHLCRFLQRCPSDAETDETFTAELTAGRFIVPFGAFSGRVHPGALRTVSSPLMFNMGRRVGPVNPLQPVINMPYSDEGANLHLERQLFSELSVTLDTYAVNGLQQGGPGIFLFSRSYRDNNSNVAVGGRATIGNRSLRFGSSISTGELQNEGPGLAAPLQTYKLTGADVSYRHEDFFRAYYEYAIRDEDSFPGAESYAYGHLAEAEVLLLEFDDPCCDPPVNKISLLARYDTLKHGGALGRLKTERFTYGLNFLLLGGSLLILNHEHWIYEDGPSINIFGMRWTATF